MIEKIRENIEKHKGKRVYIEFNGGRNKIEEYDAIITETYPFIFVVELVDQSQEVKTFTYADVLTEIVKISPQK